MSRLHRWARRAARRLVAGAPRVPHAAGSGRVPPQTRAAWQGTPPADAAPVPARTDEQSDPPETEPELDLELDAEEVARRWRASPASLVLVDIREPHELRQGHAVGAWLLPMNSVPRRLEELPKDQTLVLYCAAGVRSYGVSHWLREQGFPDTWSVPGGLGALAAAGVPTTFPPTSASTRLLAKVRLPSGEVGEVQRVESTEQGIVVSVRVPTGSGSRMVVGVDASSVESS